MCKPPRYFEFIIPATQSVSGLSPGMDPVFKVLNIGTYRTGQTSTSSESQVAFIYSRSLETKLRWRPWGRARRGSNGAARRRRADRRRNGTLLQRLGEHAQGGLQSPREPTQPTGASQRNLAHQTKPWLHSTGRRSKDLKHLSTKMLTVTLGSPSTVTFLGHTWKCPGEILRPNADCGLQGNMAIWNTGQFRVANQAETTRYIDGPVHIAAGCLFRQDARDRAHIVTREALQEVEAQVLGLDLRGASNGHVVVDLRSILQSSNNVRIIRGCHLLRKILTETEVQRSELEPGSSWSVARMRLGQTVCTPDSTDILASENAITRKQGSESNNFGLASSASDNTDYPSTNARKAYTNDTEQ